MNPVTLVTVSHCLAQMLFQLYLEFCEAYWHDKIQAIGFSPLSLSFVG